MIWREMTASDRRYVVGTWGNGSRYRMTVRRRFQLVDRLLERSRVVCLVTGNTVHAWAAGEPDEGLLHYVYVPEELRGDGLAREAITHLLGEYPKHIEVSHPWPRKNHPRFRYLPEAILSEAA